MDSSENLPGVPFEFENPFFAHLLGLASDFAILVLERCREPFLRDFREHSQGVRGALDFVGEHLRER